jgi:hypothetical protein
VSDTFQRRRQVPPPAHPAPARPRAATPAAPATAEKSSTKPRPAPGNAASASRQRPRDAIIPEPLRGHDRINLPVRVRRELDDRLTDLVFLLRRRGIRSTKQEIVELLLSELPAQPDDHLVERLAAVRSKTS